MDTSKDVPISPFRLLGAALKPLLPQDAAHGALPTLCCHIQRCRFWCALWLRRPICTRHKHGEL